APVLDGAADDPAVRRAGRAALDLAHQDRPPDERRRVAARVADLHPTDRLGADAVRRQMAIDLGRVSPQGFGMEVALGDIELETEHLYVDHALKRVDLRPDEERLGKGALGPRLACELGVARARFVAHAREQ